MSDIDRRQALAVLAAYAAAGHPAAFARPAGQRNLLDPARLTSFQPPAEANKPVNGRNVRYVDAGPPAGDAVLYFHGWGDDFKSALAREYHLIDAGFRIILPSRPGYPGTESSHGATATDAARMGLGLLENLNIESAIVVGTSTGGPAALAFAANHPEETDALVLQCAVSHPWDAAKYVPELVRREFTTDKAAFAQILGAKFAAIAALPRDEAFSALVDALAGPRKSGVLADPAAPAYIEGLLSGGSNASDLGKASDVMNIFLANAPYFTGRIEAPTLIIHDRLDPLVPFIHASEAESRTDDAEVETVDGGHFLWLGAESVKLDGPRVDFMRTHAA